MRNLAAALSLLLLVGCGGRATEPTPDAGPQPVFPASVVFGPADAPTGGTLVVGLLVPIPPPVRLVDFVTPERMEAFRAAEAARAVGDEDPVAVEEIEVIEEPVVLDSGREAGDLRAPLHEAAAAFEEATNVRVLFRNVLASECDGVPAVLAAGRVIYAGDRVALRHWLKAGGRLFCNVCFERDFGESRPGVIPESKATIGVLVDTCKEILATSERVVRLPHDPREVLAAERAGDEVRVRFREAPTRVALRDLDDTSLGEVEVDPDGTLRFDDPDGPRDPFFHRLVATWEGEGWTLRRAWRIVDLVGTAERFVFASRVVQAGTTYAPRVLFLNTLTGAPVPGREARLALAVDGEVIAEAVGRSDETGSVEARIEVPAGLEPGPAELRVDEDAFPVEVRHSLRVAVVTDRTLYRYTDEVCIRVMVHDAARGAPVEGEQVTLRLGDEERTVETSAHGIAAARMHLVEARLGTTKVVATAGGATASAEFTVRAFERPTFLVTTEPAELDLRVGESVPVVVRVVAVNGSPLVGAEVTVRGGRPQPLKGRTDSTGALEFILRPDEVTHSVWLYVKDVDGRYAELKLPVTLEGGPRTMSLRPLDEPIVGRPGRFEIVASSPGPVTLAHGKDEQVVTVGPEGRATVELTPTSTRTRWTLQSGEDEKKELRLQACNVPGGAPLLLADRRVAVVGQTLPLALEGPDGPVYVDVVRDGTLLCGLSTLVQDGHGSLDLDLRPDLAGILQLRAWRLGEDRRPLGTSVPVLVVRGRSLSVEAEVARDSWRPGETAVVDVEVRDRQGEPRAAVLGYWGVDEALLSLSPWHEPVEEVFDALPAADGKGARNFSLARDVEHGGQPRFDRARTLLGRLSGHKNLSSFFPVRHRSTPNQEKALAKERRRILDARMATMRERYLEAFTAVPLEQLETAHSLQEVFAWLRTRGHLKASELADPWGSPLDIHEELGTWQVTQRDERRHTSWTREFGYPCRITGPDLVPGTADDLTYVWRPHRVDELPGPLGRFLELVAECAESAQRSDVIDAPFWGPARSALVGWGSSAGGVFGGRGGSRDLGGGGGGRRTGRPVRVRRDFSPTLCFVPEAVVGPDGNARLEIPLKDSITTWRLRLVASDATGATGVGETRIRVNQPLHANPWIAPHLTVGDELELPVAVRNETDAPMEVALSLGLSAELAAVGAVEASVHVPPHEGAVHIFRYRAVSRGSARVRVDAVSDAARDAIERVVSVRPLEREVVEAKSGSVSSEEPWAASFPALAAGVDHEHRVTVYPSPLAETLDGFEGLIACPHG